MKTKYLKNMLAALAVGVLACGAISVPAQDSSAPTTVVPAAVTAPAPQLAYGVPQILQMAQAKVGDDTIIAYIKNSGSSYGLNADQIIYLKQQGLSDGVITAMLNQPKPGVAAYTPPAPAPQPALAPAVAAVPTPTPAPTVTYVQSVPATTYYYQPQPYYYPYYYYPSYAVYPAVSLSFGWGGYYRGGYYGGWHGGYGGWHGGYGGWHGGYGGWHGGYGGWHGGGWHH
jgi:hypothetical protein